MKRLILLGLVVVISMLSTSDRVMADPILPLPFLPISGDQDDGTIQFNASGFELYKDVQTFRVPGDIGQVGTYDLIFDFVFRGALYNNEFGYFRVDNPNMDIDGLSPSEPGYLSAALQRAEIIFPSGSDAFTQDVVKTVNKGDILSFFIVQDGTLSDLLAQNANNEVDKNPVAFFSIDTLNPDGIDHFVGFRNYSTNLTQFGFEDLTDGGDLDYDDITYNVKTVLQASPAGADRDIVFITGIDSVGTCEGFRIWVPQFLSSPLGQAFFGTLKIGNYLNFSYAGGSNFSCSAENSITKYYDKQDTCDGIATTAGELQNLIERYAQHKVTIFAHSMGGVVSAYLMAVSTDEWLQEHIASVITFDSPHQGIGYWEGWGKLIQSSCRLSNGSLQDLDSSSNVINIARRGATRVPFYTLDAIENDLPNLQFVPREWTILDQARHFDDSQKCSPFGTANPDTCEPPTAFLDNHTSIWMEQKSKDGINKGPYVGCAILAPARECAFVTMNRSIRQGEVKIEMVEVAPGITKIRFVSGFGAILNNSTERSGSQLSNTGTLIQLKLISPDGTVYGPGGLGPVDAYASTENSETYDVNNPTPGTWELEFEGITVPPDGADLALGKIVLEASDAQTQLLPVASAGGNYTGTVGTPLTLYAIGSWDSDGNIVKFEWDIDNDGSYDYITDRLAITHTYYSEFLGKVTLRVTDDDGNTDTDIANMEIQYQSVSDLALSKVVNTNSVVAGEQLTYILEVVNKGPHDGVDIILKDDLPSQLTLISTTSTQGDCSDVDGEITCHLGNLKSSETATVEIVAVTNSSIPATITNKADVSSSTTDPNLDNNSASVTTTVISPPTGAQTIFISSSASGRAGGVKFQDEDILYLEPNSVPNVWKMYFDGSDVGIGKTDVDGFDLLNEGTYGAILMSFDKPILIPGMPKVDDSDIVKFTFTAPPGDHTVGFFSPCFVGASFGLTASGENVDAIAFDTQGRLVISTDGTAQVNGSALNTKDEDLLTFTQTPFSCNPTSGSWNIFVDGSNLALTNGNEDISGAWVNMLDNKVYMSTKGSFLATSSINMVGGDGDDIFTLAPNKTGENNTDGFLSAFFDGDLVGLAKQIDDIYLSPAGSTFVSNAAVADAGDDTIVEQYEVDMEEPDLQDGELDEFDNKIEEIETELYLPFITR